MEAWRDELYHHGILGMKWGKKNGPPYPLGASDHSASEKKAGWRKSLNPYDRKISRYRRAQAAAERDAKDLKKHGYKKESDAVLKVAKRNAEKANKIENLKKSTNGKMTDTQRVALTIAGIAGAKSIKDSIKNINATNKMIKDLTQGMGKVPLKEAVGKTALQAGKVAVIAALTTIGTVKAGKYIYNKATAEEREKTNKRRGVHNDIEARNYKKKVLSSSSYTKDFLDYAKPLINKPEMVDDDQLMDLIIMEYEGDTGKKAFKK